MIPDETDGTYRHGVDFIKEFPNVGTKRGSGDPWFEIIACIKCGHVYGTLGGQ